MKPRTGFWLMFGLALLLVAGFAAYELIASPLQAMVLADYARRLNYRSASGASDRIRFPLAGPYDTRLGYVGLPEFSKRLRTHGYVISRQARLSPEMLQLADWGLFLPYREKATAGLTLLDCAGRPYYSFRQPRRLYPDFNAVPPVVANTLLFIENRELLDPNHPQRNPAVEWDRLAYAMLEKLVQVVQPGRNVPGGSTLATQIEKYRHSPDGLTLTASDKLRQMASASIRAYLDGSDTRVTRRRIVLDYLNTVPLAAVPGFGEVHGLGEALQAWFGLDFDEVNALLRHDPGSVATARAYKHVLALLISQRKPSWYLLAGRKQLDAQVNVHLGLLAEAGVITPAMRDQTRAQHLVFRTDRLADGQRARSPDKAAAAARNELAERLGLSRLYGLDRLDLTVSTTLHAASQRAVTDFLGQLVDPAAVKAAGLYGEHLLSPENDLGKVIYSFTLHQLTEAGPALRVQADSLNQPFDINQGAKLDMGSSAKLRTLITYLQIIAELHQQYRVYNADALSQLPVAPRDTLTRWAVDYLRQAPDRDLTAMLRAAMSRTYSASPAESFFTGGGLHTFVNFNKDDNGKVMELWEATRHSVNLPFIRLMRDIVHHFMYRAPSTAARILEDVEDPRRQSYLTQFADREGKTFLARFWKKYRGLPPAEATSVLLNHLTANPRRLAAVFRYLEAEADRAAFTAFMRGRLSNPAAFSAADFDQLYENYGPDRFNLADRAYIAQVHPLELWLVAYLRAHPGADWSEVVKASGQVRIEGYEWLFKTGRKNAQDSRIQSLLEIEAFQEIHRRWQKLGYPFSSLVPSYATAIGSSADRPAALAELMGYVLHDGRRQAPVSIERLEFAAATPYHTVFDRQPEAAEPVFPAEVARVIRQALVNVVKDGTARRVDGAFAALGNKLIIGGKTGTGDHRYETYAPNGTVLESRVMNRAATFAFFIGHRFFGVVTAFVPGEAAAGYHFTSALPVQLLKSLAPSLQPLVAGGEAQPREWAEEVADFEAENAPAVAAGKRPEAPRATVARPAPAAASAGTTSPVKAPLPSPVEPPQAMPAAPRQPPVAPPLHPAAPVRPPPARPGSHPDPQPSGGGFSFI